MSEKLKETNTKKICFATGILHGHFTGNVEIIKELASLGYDVTCYVTEEFADRLNGIPVKKTVYSADVSEIAKKLPPTAPFFAINSFMVGKATDVLITLLHNDRTDYDYYVFDGFFDVTEMNKVLQLDPSKFVIAYPAFVLTDENQLDEKRTIGLQQTNQKYNIHLHDFVGLLFMPNKFKKLIHTSRLFHVRPEDTDETCYFLGPNIENRAFDENFAFRKDENKKLLYISLGTIFGKDLTFYHRCIEAFKDSEEYQVLVSVGKFVDIQESFKEIPKNFSIYNYVPQTQVLSYTDVFITHAGFNSTSEAMTSGVPMVLVPQAVDQFDVARLVQKLDAGIILNKRETDITADIIRNAVKEAYDTRDSLKENMQKITDSFEETRKNRKALYSEIFC
ncbi:MAG: hypothetical protein IJJ69_07395 [Oscillospiraceae bacterium]|nr:hypothetical protein [Oscillospiraceae bacterium]